MKTDLKLDIISDIVCPWCIVGYRQWMKALESFPQVQVKITWHPFEINPGMPQGGQNLREHLKEKYGITTEQSIASRRKLQALGKSLGFSFNYFDEMKMYNTFKAHQLLYWAQKQDRQTELKLALFESYFSRGEAIDEDEVLLAVVEAVGLDRCEAEKVLVDQRFARHVKDAERFWLSQNVRGVPAVVVNDRHLLTGAREAADLMQILKALLETAA